MPSTLGRRNVLVQPENVGGVVLCLDRAQAIPCRVGIGLTDAGGVLVAQESDISAGFAVAQLAREAVGPGVVRGRVARALVRAGGDGGPSGGGPGGRTPWPPRGTRATAPPSMRNCAIRSGAGERCSPSRMPSTTSISTPSTKSERTATCPMKTAVTLRQVREVDTTI